MSAKTLRKAAALMRERARVVDTSPDGDPVEGPTFTWAEQIRHIVVEPDATHLTTFGHPAVALAVADWLDLTAETPAFEAFAEGRSGSHVGKNIRAALAVARAYLEEAR